MSKQFDHDAGAGVILVCETCRLPTFGGATVVGPNLIEEFRFCARCGVRFNRRVVEGQLESDPDWMVTVELPSELSPSQLLALRRTHSEFGEMSLAAFRQVVGSARIMTLGPYFPSHLA